MAQGKDFYIPFQDGSGRIHGICWEPEETPWAVIQVAHGMIEHIGRYEEFAQAMNREANTILSQANDLDTSHLAIDLNTEIEKVREQIQNIE